jgi:hypothetical protein|nr:MAG TPA: hypothetical protein [Crassvirales sp.]
MTSTSYNDTITYPFNTIYADTGAFVTNYSCLEKHDILNGYICTDVNHTGSFEVPMAMLPYLETILAQPKIKWEQIAMPLYYDNIIMRNTSYAIIKYFFRETPAYGARLSKVMTDKEEVYYGGNGMIFDKHMKPLVLYTVTVTGMTPVTIPYRPTKMKATISALNVRVSPQVFLKDDMLKKSIISKAIPSLVSKSFKFIGSRVLGKPTTPKVIIEDLSEWIKRPAKVGSPQTFKEDMQKFLSREDIVQDIIGCL